MECPNRLLLSFSWEPKCVNKLTTSYHGTRNLGAIGKKLPKQSPTGPREATTTRNEPKRKIAQTSNTN